MPGIAKVSKQTMQSTLIEPDVLPSIIASDGPCVYYLAPNGPSFRLARIPK
jgi:hypothetical protein